MKNNKKAILYTSASLNGAWLLITIDIALWLHKENGFNKISISCISNYNPLNFFSLILRLKNISSYLTKSKIKKISKLTKSPKSLIASNSELASFAVGKLDHANLMIGDLKIEFVRIRLNKKKIHLSSISIIYQVISDYLNFFKVKALKRKAYLNYKVSNIYAGLNILSEALRSDYKSYGSIFHSRLGILNALYKLLISTEEYKSIIFPKDTTSFVVGPAQTYIYGFFSRFMSDKGALFIDTTDPQNPFIKRELKDKYYSNIITYKKNKKISHTYYKKTTEYYKNRIKKPWEAFDYMNHLRKKNNYNKNLHFDGVSVVVYLHSFTDAQYFYGYDGYDDLMDWSFRTIFLLNSNKYISRVLVKPHPGINPIYHPGDAIANKYLKSLISNFNKVQWIDFHLNVEHINTSGQVIGITHHGSIAEELVFNKYPVIASTYAPWGIEYKFGYFWSDHRKYESLISSQAITEILVTKSHTEELYRYAIHKRSNLNSTNGFEIEQSWKDMMQIYGIKSSYEHGEDMENINHLISMLDTDDKKFQDYIVTRLNSINSLNVNMSYLSKRN